MKFTGKVLALAFILISFNSFAAGKNQPKAMMSGDKAHGPAGCGLGQMLFKDKDGLVFQVLAATFNGSSGNQTFGMSSGTLGCEDASSAKVAAVSFIEANRIALETDAARGEGETLDAYISIIQGNENHKSLIKQNFASIFKQEANAQDIHNNILSTIHI